MNEKLNQTFQPKLIDQPIPESTINKLKEICEVLKNDTNTKVDDNQFFRKYVHNQPLASMIHKQYLAKKSFELFGEKLLPSYCFTSMYHRGQGFCPYHIDRPQCYRSLTVCINQNKPWPIYITSKFDKDYSKTDLIAKEQEIREQGTEYLLKPGQGIVFSGTDHPHWREKIQADNFCDLIFFHFVKEDFQGEMS